MEQQSRPIVYVVHCVDVEGPMTETLEATWERIYAEDRVWMRVEPSRENLRKLQRGELDMDLPPETLELLRSKYSPQNLGYLADWEHIDQSILHATSAEFRKNHGDSDGNDYAYSWFIYDHYGFANNPRFHDVGIHRIFDHYRHLFLDENPCNDGLYWHYHHVAASQDALEWNPNWLSTRDRLCLVIFRMPSKSDTVIPGLRPTKWITR